MLNVLVCSIRTFQTLVLVYPVLCCYVVVQLQGLYKLVVLDHM